MEAAIFGSQSPMVSMGVKKPVEGQCCFTSTETIRTYQGRGTQDGHLDFHTAPEL